MKRLVAGVLVACAVMAVVPAPAAEAAQRASALTLLNSLPVSPERMSGYARERFADWYDANRNGCDSREDVLIAERIKGRVVGCTVVGGTWLSAYDGVVTRNSSSFDIDHRVPLEEAWQSGAWRWTAATRDRYANDTGYAASLIAVTQSTNRSKGGREPSEWMPPLRTQRCQYIKLWIGVKYRWRLAVDAAEKSYLTRALSRCDPLMTVPRRAVVHTR